MAAISGIAPAAPPQAPPAHDQKGGRAAVEFGAAVTHQDLVREKLRVDPAALADKMRKAQRAKLADPREQRMAQDKAEYEESLRKGQYVDIEA
ncbi:MAG TPA: hypothetical protein VEA80_17380 [Vitreimonas sp.]|uniref:hypothetical protein n=1 Tax=Vitreimonas sp. TaxID=3069702 RepID=UPI002D62809E|nr:hypothetical protein [Vitreimonas sp.]HYD89254.1 hypothetical protein [Vitreimonas sp.]